jgi:AcrR family transcriptional regulator
MFRITIAVSLVFSACLAAQGKNVLMYGNSFLNYNAGAGVGLRKIAEEAGFATPNVYERFVSSSGLAFHATDPVQVGTITNTLPAGQQWDAVVMQGQSLEATNTLGNPQLFRSSAVAITANVLNHSPNAKAVLAQTWARGQGHHLYLGTFASALTMHGEIHDNYHLAAQDIDAAFGAGTAKVARAGDGVALQEFTPAAYATDLFHPGPRTTLLTSMCLFTSIYEQRICDISANLSFGSPLWGWLNFIGLSAADWDAMAAIADRCADPSLRPFPGSGDQLLLESGNPPGPTNACGHVAVGAGDYLVLQLTSRNGVYDQAPAVLLATAFVNGAPPSPFPSLPELHVDPTNMFVLQSTPSPPATIFTVVPFSLPGLSLLVQAVAFAPSTASGHPGLTTTEGHVIEFQ